MGIVILKSFGVILILFATFVSTVKISEIEKKIQDEAERIEKFNDQRILAAISMLQASNISNSRNRYLMEANLSAYLNQGKDRIESLRKRALNQIVIEVKQWNSLFSKGVQSEIFQKAENNIANINLDKGLSVESKIEKAEEILMESRKKFASRLAEKHKERNEYIDMRRALDNEKATWNFLFVWSQIIGLCLIALSETIDLITRKPSKKD